VSGLPATGSQTRRNGKIEAKIPPKGNPKVVLKGRKSSVLCVFQQPARAGSWGKRDLCRAFIRGLGSGPSIIVGSGGFKKSSSFIASRA
jgi:hypothetical protein